MPHGHNRGENQNLATVTYQVNLSRRSLCNSHALRRSTYATCIVPPVSSDNHGTASRRSQIRHVCVPGCGTSMQQWKETERSISDETEGGPESSATASCFERPPRLVVATTMALCGSDLLVNGSGPLKRSDGVSFYSYYSFFPP